MDTASPQPSRRIPNREVASYSIGAVGSNVIYALVATYLLYFYTVDAPYCKQVCDLSTYAPERTNSDHPGLGTLTFRLK